VTYFIEILTKGIARLEFNPISPIKPEGCKS
jgi:hypothetical protein